eukprot:SAG31_NODE_1434_length_8364_cov_8.012220_4_plen_40_part_00
MDIEGGMGKDIYDSMSEGIHNANVVLPCLTSKYYQSRNW